MTPEQFMRATISLVYTARDHGLEPDHWRVGSDTFGAYVEAKTKTMDKPMTSVGKWLELPVSGMLVSGVALVTRPPKPFQLFENEP